MSAASTIRHLDVTGTFCPLPILLAARELMHLAAGDRLEIVGDDPGILEDMPVWCQRAGHRLVRISERQGKIVSLIEKGSEKGGEKGGEAALSPGHRRGDGAGGGGGNRPRRRPARRGA